jgi:hypothetical protein
MDCMFELDFKDIENDVNREGMSAISLLCMG